MTLSEEQIRGNQLALHNNISKTENRSLQDCIDYVGVRITPAVVKLRSA